MPVKQGRKYVKTCCKKRIISDPFLYLIRKVTRRIFFLSMVSSAIMFVFLTLF